MQKQYLESLPKHLSASLEYPLKNRCFIDQCLFNYNHSQCCAKCEEQDCEDLVKVRQLVKRNYSPKECIDTLSSGQPIFLPLKMLIKCSRDHGCRYYPVKLIYISENYITLSTNVKHSSIRTTVRTLDLINFLKETRLAERKYQISEFFYNN